MRLFLFLLISNPLWAGSQEVHSKKGMVASQSMPASRVGSDILAQGGNAVDAAVALGFALAVTHPSAGNIGGGGFMVIHLADGTTLALDFRETAPAAASRDMYLDEEGNVVQGLSLNSHLATGVPGSVAGLLAALEKYGSMSRQQVMAGAIRLARDGFPLSYELARAFERLQPRMARYPASTAVFSKKGKAYQAGDIWKQPDLADTLTRISKQGRAGFYEGRTADLLVAEMKQGGGLVSHKDLKDYRVKWREPIRGTYRGHEIISMPAPSSGGILLVQMLNMLSPYDLGQSGWGSAETVHLMVEAERRAYADRAEYLGDPDFVKVPTAQLTDPAYARRRFADFDPARASGSDAIGAGSWPKESTETTHFSVVDASGAAVACTTTLNLGYGNKIVVTGAGFLLNNEMDDFSSKPNTPNAYGLIGSEANEIQPGKRMLSSMTPTIVTKDGKVLLVTGSPGGSTIITTVLQVVINVIDHDMGLGNAVGKPRFHHQWKPDRVSFEKHGLSKDTVAILTGMGHKGVAPMGFRLGHANSILVRDGWFIGVSDPRADGGAAGPQ